MKVTMTVKKRRRAELGRQSKGSRSGRPIERVLSRTENLLYRVMTALTCQLLADQGHLNRVHQH